MTDQTAPNPYSLAQYLVAEPSDEKKDHNFLDADPTLQHLRARLQAFMVEQLLTDAFHELMARSGHPNFMLKKLAERADEFCPGRTQSDLLYKMIAVHDVFDLTIRGIAAALLKPKISMSVGFDRSQLDRLFSELDKIRSTSKL